MEGNLHFKINWASLIVGRQFPSTSPWRAYIWRGDLTEGFLCYDFRGRLYLEGLIHGGAYFWNFTVLNFVCVQYSFFGI